MLIWHYDNDKQCWDITDVWQFKYNGDTTAAEILSLYMDPNMGLPAPESWEVVLFTDVDDSKFLIANINGQITFLVCSDDSSLNPEPRMPAEILKHLELQI